MKTIAITTETPTTVHSFVMAAESTETAKQICKFMGLNVTKCRQVQNYKGTIRDPRNFN